LEAEQQSLRTLQQQLHEIRELLDAAKKRLSLPQKEADLVNLQARFDELEQEATSLKKAYQELKFQEQIWNDDRTRLALAYQDVERKRERLELRIQKLQHDVHELRVPELREEIQELEVSLPELPPDLQQSIQESGLSSEDYREQINVDEQRLERIPEVEIEYSEELYHQQVADLERLRGEVEDMRTRAREARELFDRATNDYSHHIDPIFSQGMNREFRQLCRAADAQSAITVLKSESDLDDWSLDIRIGFDGKARLPLSSAPLSRGQEVLTGLYLVLAALRAVKATPILILDELMSLLDERNAPRVLAGLRDAGVQCFVATPQSRPGADEFADVMWGFFKRPETELYAPPIAVVARRENGA
jgi:chromosome segregation ATPase